VYVCRHSSLAEDRSEAACALSIISDSILKRAGVLASPPTIRSIPWTTEPLSLSLSLPCLIYFVRSIIAAAENALYISMQAAACPVAGTIDVMNNVDSANQQVIMSILIAACHLTFWWIILLVTVQSASQIVVVFLDNKLNPHCISARTTTNNCLV
jgi:hypothetical protein